MASKSPFTDDIYNEWEFLAMSAYREPIPENELLARSKALYDRCLVNEEWQVNPLDASLVTNLRFGQLATKQQYGEALVICETFLNHPQLSPEEHKIEYITIKNSFHSMQYMIGEVNESVLGLRSLLSAERIDIVHVRNSIWNIASSLPPDDKPDTPIINLAVELLNLMGKCPDTVLEARTNQEFATAFIQASALFESAGTTQE